MGDWDWGLGLVLGIWIGDQDLGLWIGIKIGDWELDWVLELGIWIGT